MLPTRRSRIEDQLVKWGYSRYRVEQMDDFRLMSCYNFESCRRNNDMYRYSPPGLDKDTHRLP